MTVFDGLDWSNIKIVHRKRVGTIQICCLPKMKVSKLIKKPSRFSQFYNVTRRYGPLLGPIFSSCGRVLSLKKKSIFYIIIWRITYFFQREKEEEKIVFFLVLPFEDITLWPEISSPPRFRIQGFGQQCRHGGACKFLCLILDSDIVRQFRICLIPLSEKKKKNASPLLPLVRKNLKLFPPHPRPLW